MLPSKKRDNHDAKVASVETHQFELMCANKTYKQDTGSEENKLNYMKYVCGKTPESGILVQLIYQLQLLLQLPSSIF
jgi:hypothetical protein